MDTHLLCTVQEFLQQSARHQKDIQKKEKRSRQLLASAHLVMPGGYSDDFIADLQKELKTKFGIGHTTFQIEQKRIDNKSDQDCG